MSRLYFLQLTQICVKPTFLTRSNALKHFNETLTKTSGRVSIFYGGTGTLEQHTLELIVTVVIAVLGSNGLWAYLQSKSKIKTARDRMILGLGHAEIFRVTEKYIHRGGITMDELEDLDKYLYKPYSELGGNGTAAAVVQKCRELPIITKAEADRRDAEIYKKGELEE